MHCQGRIAVVQAAGVGEYDSTAQKGVAHNKTEKRPADFFRTREGKDKENIHGDATELKRKVPQIIDAVSCKKGKRQLFPDLTAQHKKSECEKKFVCRAAEIFFSVRGNGIHGSASIIL